MRIPRVNLFLPVMMLLVIVFLCFVSHQQEVVIEQQRESIRTLAGDNIDLLLKLQEPCEQREPETPEDGQRETNLARR